MRFDRFDLSALDQNTNTNRDRVDTKLSPQAAVIVKPIDNLSIYGAYSVSYLPASGDQFSALNDGTLILDPQKFENKEVGVKWNITPRLLYHRRGLRAQPHRMFRSPIRTMPDSFFLSGSNRIRGFETELNGYVTDEWQSTLGYAYTDARDHQRHLDDDRRRQPRAARPASSVLVVEQVSVHPDVGGLARRDLLLGFVCVVRRHRQIAGLRPLRCRASYVQINETWKAQLNVENIFNKGYWASADGNNNISPGPGAPYVFRRRQASDRGSLERLKSRVSLDFSVQQAS